MKISFICATGGPTIFFPMDKKSSKATRISERRGNVTVAYAKRALILAHGAGNSVLEWNTRSRTMYVARAENDFRLDRTTLVCAPGVCIRVGGGRDPDRSIHAE